MNYREARESGFNRVVKYSVFFQWKLAICVLAGVINFVIVVVAMVDPETIATFKEIGECIDVITQGLLPDHEVNVRLFVIGSRLFSIFSWAISY